MQDVEHLNLQGFCRTSGSAVSLIKKEEKQITSGTKGHHGHLVVCTESLSGTRNNHGARTERSWWSGVKRYRCMGISISNMYCNPQCWCCIKISIKSNNPDMPICSIQLIAMDMLHFHMHFMGKVMGPLIVSDSFTPHTYILASKAVVVCTMAACSCEVVRTLYSM